MRRLLLSLTRSAVRAVSGRGLGLQRFRPLAAAYELAYSKLRPSGVVLTEVDGRKMYVNLDDQSFDTESIGESLFMVGLWERMQTEMFKSLVRPGMTVLDVGAHFGYYTLLASELVGAHGRVFSFEPNSGNYELLSRNVRINNCGNVTLFQKAVSDRAEHTRLYVNSGNFGVRSLASGNVPQGSGFEETETVRLDGLFEEGALSTSIDIIKMDIEGAEGLALAGARKVISQCHPPMLMEFNPPFLQRMGTDPLELLRYMESEGYIIYVIDTAARTVTAVDAEGALAQGRKFGARDLLLARRQDFPSGDQPSSRHQKAPSMS